MNIKELFKDLYSKKNEQGSCGPECLFFNNTGEETVPNFAQATVIQHRVMRRLHSLGWRMKRKDGFGVLHEEINKSAHEACKEGMVNERDVEDPAKFFSVRNLII